jgi:MGT family glycosyltransferase
VSSRPSIVFVAMSDANHFRRLQALIERTVAAGARTTVFTDRAFAPLVERAGADFRDLLAGRPPPLDDDSSLPVAARFVTFAARYGAAIRDEAAAVSPDAVVHTAFSVIGRVVAESLGVPRVLVCAGHNVLASRLAEIQFPPIAPSNECLAAVEELRDRFGIADASPLSYVSPASPDLNLYSEPRQFLTAEEQAAFEPVAYLGSTPDGLELRPPAQLRPLQTVYISFGTIVWRYFREEALDAIEAVAAALRRRPGIRVAISLGGADVNPSRIARIVAENVRVERWVDQWDALGEADAFVTHQGVNSTHEAILAGVPMLSAPFFWDQPALAERCAKLGLAVPLGAPRRGLTEAEILSAFDELERRRDSIRRALALAREWELETIAGRDAVVGRILELARRSP